MCETFQPCTQCVFKSNPKKSLTVLLLDCWQREYDERPYRNFQFKRIELEKRFQRKFGLARDFPVIVRFLYTRNLCTVSLVGVGLLQCSITLIDTFVSSLRHVRKIELRLMELPTRFFEQMRENAKQMQVRELILEGSPMNTKDMRALRQFIIQSKTLCHLHVGHCSIKHYNFAIIADAVQKSTSLKSFVCNRLLGRLLTLETNKMAHLLSSLIWQNKLEEIEMRECEFTAHDMVVVSEYMAKPSSKLRKLNFAQNIIACDGTEHLFRAIVASCSLTHLDISRNSLGTHGGYVVARYLSSCYFLQYLNITYNDIGAEAIYLIMTSFKKPLKMLKFKLYGNHFDTKIAKVLRRLLASGVVPQDTIDITATLDGSLNDYRVIPYN